MIWQPSDKSDELFWAIRERIDDAEIKEPIVIDLSVKSLGYARREIIVGVLNINMIHIALLGSLYRLISDGRKGDYGKGFCVLVWTFSTGRKAYI